MSAALAYEGAPMIAVSTSDIVRRAMVAIAVACGGVALLVADSTSMPGRCGFHERSHLGVNLQ
jgi:hypothetical protein